MMFSWVTDQCRVDILFEMRTGLYECILKEDKGISSASKRKEKKKNIVASRELSRKNFISVSSCHV